MKPILVFLRTTFIGGLVFLVPIVALVIVLGKALELARKFVKPLAVYMPGESVIGVKSLAMLLAIGLTVLFCFLAGLFGRTILARRIVNGLEAAVLSKVPGYEFFKNTSESMLGAETHVGYPVVLASFSGAWRIGLQIEAIENGLVAVFIPGAPNPQSGAVHFLPPDRIKPTGIPLASALNCLRHHGVGSNALLRNLSIEKG